MTFGEYLSLPYTLLLEAIYLPEGKWIRKASYVELPESAVENFSPLVALAELERRRVEITFEKLRKGEPVLVHGSPLKSVNLASELRRLNLEKYIDYLDLDEKQIMALSM